MSCVLDALDRDVIMSHLILFVVSAYISILVCLLAAESVRKYLICCIVFIITLNSSIVISIEFLFEKLFIKDSIFFKLSKESAFSSEIFFSFISIISSLIHSFLSSFLSSSRYSSSLFYFKSIMIVYQMIDFIFVFCEIFSNTENISAFRWLMKYKHEMLNYKQQDNRIFSNKYFSSLNMLLIDEMTEWSKSHSDTIRLLNDSSSIHDTINAFKFLFCNRFSFRVVEVILVSIDVKLTELRQKQDETLTAYYKKIIDLMQRIKIKNRSIFQDITSSLFSFESAMLNIILRTFIRELFEFEIRRE